MFPGRTTEQHKEDCALEYTVNFNKFQPAAIQALADSPPCSPVTMTPQGSSPKRHSTGSNEQQVTTSEDEEFFHLLREAIALRKKITRRKLFTKKSTTKSKKRIRKPYRKLMLQSSDSDTSSRNTDSDWPSQLSSSFTESTSESEDAFGGWVGPTGSPHSSREKGEVQDPSKKQEIRENLATYSTALKLNKYQLK